MARVEGGKSRGTLGQPRDGHTGFGRSQVREKGETVGSDARKVGRVGAVSRGGKSWRSRKALNAAEVAKAEADAVGAEALDARAWVAATCLATVPVDVIDELQRHGHCHAPPQCGSRTGLEGFRRASGHRPTSSKWKGDFQLCASCQPHRVGGVKRAEGANIARPGQRARASSARLFFHGALRQWRRGNMSQ